MCSNRFKEKGVIFDKDTMGESEAYFATFIKSLDSQDNYWQFQEPGLLKAKDKNVNVKRYNGLINYNSGLTAHYEENRVFREKELIQLLGEGKPVASFLVRESNEDIQIQEILDNAIINIYSFFTHKKITLFAPPPHRIIFLYESVGEVAPEELIAKSENNTIKGCNRIYCL